MSGAVLVAIGLLLCLTGAWSMRLAVLAAGFGAAWLIADAFDASSSAALVIGLGGALLAFLITLLMSKILFFFIGAVVGAVIGAKLFVLLDRGDASVLLAVVFVPAVAALCGFLAGRWSRTFLLWATAFGGASLVLSGLGRMAPEQLGDLRVPDDTTGQVVNAVCWLGLGLLGRAAQTRLIRRRSDG
jgi:hypothetical protein